LCWKCTIKLIYTVQYTHTLQDRTQHMNINSNINTTSAISLEPEITGNMLPMTILQSLLICTVSHKTHCHLHLQYPIIVITSVTGMTKNARKENTTQSKIWGWLEKAALKCKGGKCGTKQVWKAKHPTNVYLILVCNTCTHVIIYE